MRHEQLGMHCSTTAFAAYHQCAAAGGTPGEWPQKYPGRGPWSSVPARPRPRAHLTFGTHDPRTGTARHAFIYSSSPQVHASRPATAARRPPRDGGPPPSPTHHRTPPNSPRSRRACLAAGGVACGCRAGRGSSGPGSQLVLGHVAWTGGRVALARAEPG